MKSQISFEFILVFAITLFMFIVIVSAIVMSFDTIESPMTEIEIVATDVKSRVITASLTQTHFSSTITLPDRYGDRRVTYDIVEDPDNLFIVRNADNSQAMLTKIMPKIDTISGSGNTLTIIKSYSPSTIEIVRS